jgi:signal transduction histidine kinase
MRLASSLGVSSARGFAPPAQHRTAHRDRNLAERCLRAREDEARRIAHRLHDEAGQVMATVQLALQELEEELPAQQRCRTRRVRELVAALDARLRQLSHDLRPTIVDDLGLASALRFLAEAFSSDTGIAVEIKGDMEVERLDPLTETTLYRVFQEALANVARHSRARRVVLHLHWQGGALRCSIADDGIGLRSVGERGNGLGLLGIRERLAALGGRLEVRSTPGRGTELLATLPARRRRWPAGS